MSALGLSAVAPPGYEPVPARVLTDVAALPCDLYIWRGPRPVLYAARGGDLKRVVRRAERGMSFLVREIDSALLRKALAQSLPQVLANHRIAAAERSKTAYSIAAKVLAPVFLRDQPLDREGLALTHQTIDALTMRLLDDEELVWAMVATMQKHLATHTHAMNTAVYGIVLARFVQLGNADTIRDVARGGLLHDIGKNRVPLGVLDKPAPLDAGEWMEMRGHARSGYDMIVRALGYAPSYAHVILEHHERLDGTGYPAGRSGEQIPIDAQLVAIVDAFDALTSRRPYKGECSAFDALRTLRVVMRGQFNDELLREFIKLLGGWSALRDDLHDVGRALRAG